MPCFGRQYTPVVIGFGVIIAAGWGLDAVMPTRDGRVNQNDAVTQELNQGQCCESVDRDRMCQFGSSLGRCQRCVFFTSSKILLDAGIFCAGFCYLRTRPCQVH